MKIIRQIKKTECHRPYTSNVLKAMEPTRLDNIIANRRKYETSLIYTTLSNQGVILS